MSTHLRSLTHKFLIWLALAGLIFSNLNGVGLQPAQAKSAAGNTAAPGAAQSAAPVTATIRPSQAVLARLNLASAGSGDLFRARVALKSAQDITRLEGLGVTVLQQGGDVAVVEATAAQLAGLARLRFEPTQIDSVAYMLDVQSLSGGPMESMADVTSSSAAMLALASVDSDADGLTDTEESWWCTDPLDNNSDFAGPPTASDPNDGAEVAAIMQGITAYGPPFEMWPNFKPYHSDGTCLDGDFDGVPDNAELYMIGTSPQRESSDLDKFDDGQELFGVTFCPASSGPCGYGILPRAEDTAFVTANLPAWVKAPGNSPFVAAFPQPDVEVAPSSLKLTQVTVITNTKGTVVGTEKTYGTASTKGTSTSLANTVTWNNWEEVSTTTQLASTSVNPQFNTGTQSVPSANTYAFKNAESIVTWGGAGLALCAGGGLETLGGACLVGALVAGVGIAVSVGKNALEQMDAIQEAAKTKTCTVNQSQPISCPATGVHAPSSQESIILQSPASNKQDASQSRSQTYYTLNSSNGDIQVQPTYRESYPVFTPTITNTQGSSHGGAQTTTTSQYEQQTISQSSTDQFSNNWSTATAVDSSHAADLRFTYNIVNNGTDYAREINSLTFNVYIGSDPNPATTYCAVGASSNCQLPMVNNLFPGDSLTYTSSPITLTLDQMSAIDQGAPMRIVMEDLSFGQDQVFYQDAVNGSVQVAMEDGYDDGNETIDSYLIPVWSPTDTLQDVVQRYFPTIEDSDGNLLAIFTPESKSAVPIRCIQDQSIAPASNTQVFCKHALTATSWWNFYLSAGLNDTGVFKDTLAIPGSSMLVRMVSDRDLDGYNDRNEILLGTNPDDPTSHPGPNILAGFTKSCTGNDCTVRMAFQNLGNYDASGVGAILYTPDGKVNVTNNTIGGSGLVPAGSKVVVGQNDTLQYTITDPSYTEPVIVVSYNDPQGNHRFILPAAALVSDLNNDLSALNGAMLPDPGVDISSTSANQANFVINSPDPTPITNGKLFVEYLDGAGHVLHEDVTTQDFPSGPTVISAPVDLNTYPPASTTLLAFFTDSEGNILDSSARPLASFGPDPLPEANLTTGGSWGVGTQSVVSLPDPWDFGSVEPGTTLHANLSLSNTGLGNLRYSLTGLGSGVSMTGVAAGSLSPSASRQFAIQIDTAGLAVGPFSKTLTLRTNDPNHGSVAINIQGTLATPAGTASAYKVNDYHPWDQYVYVAGPHNQNDVVSFTHSLADDPTRMFPLYLCESTGCPPDGLLKGVGEYGVDFSGQTAPFGVFGTGADGDLTVPSGPPVYTDNTRSALATTASNGQLNLTLSSTTGFAAGQEVLVIQTQGTGTGGYEFGTIANVAGNTLTLSKNLTNTYTVGGNSRAQVMRVMNYHDVTVQSGGTLTAHAWDGSTGGVVVFRSSGTVSIVGSITVSGSTGSTVQSATAGGAIGGGFRGGNAATTGGGTKCISAWTGDGTNGPSTSQSSANGNGGGAGHGSAGNCAGGMGGGSGGGGGYGTAGTKSTSFSYGDGYNGDGGQSVGLSDLSVMLFGGGGGGGLTDNTGSVGAGGSGGGIIFMAGRSIAVSSSGSVSANGGKGGDGDYGQGGGGAGGSIYIKGNTVSLDTSRVTALGGARGIYGTNSSIGGGVGGDGRIRVEYGTLAGSSSPAATTQQVNYYSLTGQTTPLTVFGTGADGNLTVTSGQTIYTDNIRSALASTANTGQLNLVLSSATGFAVGQEVLVVQTQGTGAGSYEFGTIATAAGNTLILGRNLANTYTVDGNSTAQVMRVMNYHDITIQSGGTLTAHAWDGATGGIVVFRASSTTTINGQINVSALGYRGGKGGTWSPNYPGGGHGESYGATFENPRNAGDTNSSPNGGGGGGGYGRYGGGTGGGGGGASYGGSGTVGAGNGGQPGGILGPADLSSIYPGSGGGGGGKAPQNTPNSLGGDGGVGGGIVMAFARAFDSSNGTVQANGASGGNCTNSHDESGGGGGGSGGAILIKSQSAILGTSLLVALGGGAGNGCNASENGGSGGAGRIRVEYGTLVGSTNPAASAQQVNFFSLTGSSTSNLYLPEAISAGGYKRYQLEYGQRALNTTGGDQPFSAHLPNRQYTSASLSVLLEPVVGSGSTFNFCLDIGNDGTCDWTANAQSFGSPVELDSPNLAAALNAYISAQNSSQDSLLVPIRVNISTPADAFLFDLAGTPSADADLAPGSLTIAPQNGNPADNIPEGSLVNLNATVRNTGTYKADNFTVAFYLGDPAANGSLIGSTFIQSLAAGATSPAQTVVWNTAGLLGPESIYVKVDASGAVAESSETNNVASAAAVVKKKPDLVVESLTLPVSRAGETVQATVVVKNQGQADVSGAIIRLYNGSISEANALNSASVVVAQNATVTVTIPYTLPTAGPQTLWAKADPLDAIAEADESNNTASAQAQVGWDHLVIDAGGAGDNAYDSGAGFGFLSGTAVTKCGNGIQQTYREAGSAEDLTYRFDNLLPGRAYHLDLTFATCSGTRSMNMFVNNQQVYENVAYQLSGALPALNVTGTPQTVSILLDPADYADGTLTLAIRRAAGLSGPLVNIIDLQEVGYCYRDSGPAEQPWSASNGCGYDPAKASDGFNGWGSLPEQTVRFSDTGSLDYKFTGLNPARLYNSRLSFYEGDGANRIENVSFDGSLAQTFNLSSSVQRASLTVPPAAFADGALDLNIQRTIAGDAVVSEVALEENTRQENGRYPAPAAPGVSPTSTPTPTAIPPQVVLSSFTATWNGSKVSLQWGTTTEINNSAFTIYRSLSGTTWTELLPAVDSTRACGNFSSPSPVLYNFDDTTAVPGTTYYYQLQYSGESCGAGLAMSDLTAEALAPGQPSRTPTPTATATITATPAITVTPSWTPTPSPSPTLTVTPVLSTLTLTSVAASDGWVLESAENSNVGGTLNAAATTFNLGDDTARRQYRAILSFATGAGLPDSAVITSVLLKLRKSAVIGGGDPVALLQGFLVDIKNGTFGAAALQASDFQTAANKTYGPFKPALAGSWYTLDVTGGKAYVNKLAAGSGLTQIRLRFQLDDNNNAIANDLVLFSGNAPAANQPQLIITYYVP